MTETLVTQSAALKEYYAPDVAESLVPDDCPAYAMLKKNTAFGGKSYLRIPFKWGPSAGTSTDFATAQAIGLATAAQTSEVQVTRCKTHSIGYIDNETMQATEKDMHAFIDAARSTTDDLVVNLMRDWEICFFRDGYGTRGRLSHTQTLSETTITLARKSDAQNFEVGQRYDLTAAVGASAAAKAHGTSTNPLIITGVDVDGGTLTVGYALDNAVNGIPTVAIDDYLVMAGDVTTGRGKPCGLLGWCPDSAPTSGDSFFGLDRSVHQRLYGQRVDISTLGISFVEGILRGASKLGSFGGKANRGFCSHATLADIIAMLESKVMYVERETKAGIGFRGVKIITPKGDCEIYASSGCDDDHIWLVDINKWGIYSLNKAIQVSDEDGFTVMRAHNADACEVRYKSMGNFGCTNPGASVCNIKLR